MHASTTLTRSWPRHFNVGITHKNFMKRALFILSRLGKEYCRMPAATLSRLACTIVEQGWSILALSFQSFCCLCECRMLVVCRTEQEMETSKVTLARWSLFLVRWMGANDFLVWVVMATMFLTCICDESGSLWRDNSAFTPIGHWVNASLLVFFSCNLCVWTLIQEKESSNVTCSGGLVRLLVMGVGMELFWFPWRVARVLLARLCKACEDLATEG